MTTSSCAFAQTLKIDRTVAASWILGISAWLLIVGGLSVLQS